MTWHDPFDRYGRGCEADPARVCRGQIYGDVRICVKCGRRIGDVDNKQPRRHATERTREFYLRRAVEDAEVEALPF